MFSMEVFKILFIFFFLDSKFRRVGTLELSNPPGWGKKKGLMPCPPSTLQHFSLIAQSSKVFLCNGNRILIKTSCRDDVHQFMVLVLI